ncbi:tyrosinase central domain-containing protein [Colletotrichum scovillei]|uniref:Tyrosinase central domain-containing protein n=1 Tax=Colletotrichum scovillei TaxID=1209932 RepID=A0A9P7RJP6_9PEZI|nr:tyrosinase central domain-containing protein [Colletotrichum scovillei]KAG7076815.1 tyrosinase central domain-containing protein [Colletotrichum scovillei]KAG7083953.1 tyrosinase central domain-containing protein [Colletotrichum scovillei]
MIQRYIAERRSSDSVHQVSELGRSANGRNVDKIIQSGVGTRRVVLQCPGAKDVLQNSNNPVDAVDLGVVQEEGGLAGRDEGIRAGVAFTQMASPVNADLAAGRIPVITLHNRLEPLNVVVTEDQLSGIA